MAGFIVTFQRMLQLKLASSLNQLLTSWLRLMANLHPLKKNVLIIWIFFFFFFFQACVRYLLSLWNGCQLLHGSHQIIDDEIMIFYLQLGNLSSPQICKICHHHSDLNPGPFTPRDGYRSDQRLATSFSSYICLLCAWLSVFNLAWLCNYLFENDTNELWKIGHIQAQIQINKWSQVPFPTVLWMKN